MKHVGYTINDWLKAIYDVEDPVYQSLISNIHGIPEEHITQPQHLNLGVMASTLEYVRRYTRSLVDQLNVQNASGDILEYMLAECLGYLKLKGEDETAWKNRVIDLVLSPKVSKAAIIYHMRPFSSTEPSVDGGDEYTAYADYSYADVYTSYMVNGEHTFPAIATDVTDTAYFFILTLTNTNPDDIPGIIDKLNSIVAAGIRYEIRIHTI